MKRLLTSCAIAAALILPMTGPAHAGETKERYVGPHKTPSCRFRYLDGAVAFSQWEVRRTIECATRRWSVPGQASMSGLDVALCIARRESGFNWYADNPFSSASGVFQFLDGTWDGQVSARTEFIGDQEIQRTVWNARSNVLIAIRLAHASGWGPWGGGC